eukprot:gnl/TRDRNA2_/TRDRNA2_148716_c1_seq2.p1 gnl/TRDRNA2_/TRDRNA2_148716_c1~~gnl/TRDRNA2_/TRDRNA2_148716_c1_seq2.p1  ORF type:complete len:474 (+),score=89.42 gnl/TRDRNA2_/TRDRNA2_148716_c1_seq2:159-1424(+)
MDPEKQAQFRTAEALLRAPRARLQKLFSRPPATAPPRQRTLHNPAEKDNAMVSGAGPAPSRPVEFEQVTKKMWKQLRSSTMMDNVEEVKVQIEQIRGLIHTNPVALDGSCNLTLHCAAACGNTAVLGLLFELRADVATTDLQGQTALDLLEFWATKARSPEEQAKFGTARELLKAHGGRRGFELLNDAPVSSSRHPPRRSRSRSPHQLADKFAASRRAAKAAAPPKEKPDMSSSDDQEAASLAENVGPRQKHLLAGQMRNVWKLDPARNPDIEQEHRHLVRSIPLSELRNTHDKVDPIFRHGQHKGLPVASLTEDLLTERITVSDVPKLVAVKCEGKYYVVFGNRRLKAMKDYAARLLPRGQVCVPAIVHSYPHFSTLERPLALALSAKFVHASSSCNDGLFADFRGPPRPSQKYHGSGYA